MSNGKVDYTRLNTSALMELKYNSNFVSLPFEEKYFKNLVEFNYLDNLYEETQGEKPTVLPCVVHAQESVFQRIIPLRGYIDSSNQNLVIMWGGYSNKEHWLTVVPECYTLTVKKDEGACAKFEFIEVELVEHQEKAPVVKAQKLSVLEVRDYRIQEVKSVTTSYGPTYIVVIENQGEFWANTQLKRLIDMLGDVTVLKNMTLKVLNKTTTSTGHLSVRIGLQK